MGAERREARSVVVRDSLQDATSILGGNLRTVRINGREYRSTVPSKDYYVHQWNWDAAKVAMGLVHIDPRLAHDELRALVSGQLPNGMIPHVIYNP